MGDTLNQLGQLLLASVPSMIAFLVVWGGYRGLVHGKLQKVLAERHSLTEGAIEKAKADIAMAESRTAEYERRVREARAEIFKAQEVRMQQMLETRGTALATARRNAQSMVKEARVVLEKDRQAAQANLTQQAESLATEIIQSILRPAMAAGEP